MIDKAWLAYLAIPAGWTIFFSFFNTPGIRGWRNLGWIGCYILGLVMLWAIGWRSGGATWLAVGLATGFLYYLYQLWSAWGESDPEVRAQLRTIVHGALFWPIMLPEVVEYSLADAGLLASAPPPPTEGNGGSQKGDVEQDAAADEALS